MLPLSFPERRIAIARLNFFSLPTTPSISVFSLSLGNSSFSFRILIERYKIAKKHEKPPENFSSYLISFPIVRCVVWKIFFQRPLHLHFTWSVFWFCPSLKLASSFEDHLCLHFAFSWDSFRFPANPLQCASAQVKFLQTLCFVDTLLYVPLPLHWFPPRFPILLGCLSKRLHQLSCNLILYASLFPLPLSAIGSACTC